MRLLLNIIVAIFVIALMSLVGAVAWIMSETTRSVHQEAVASTERVVREAQALAWKELTWRGSEGRYAKLAFPDWRSSDTLKVIAPGHCVSLTWTGEPTLTTCSGSVALGRSPPAWFQAVYHHLYERPDSVRRSIILNRVPAGFVVTTPDWMATTIRVWGQVGVVFAVAIGMAASISVMSALVIGYALRPAVVLVAGIRRLEAGDYGVRLPTFRSADFRLIARAVNDLKERLLQSTADRAELTKKLFVAQEEERLSLARDLHDEFGQCLTATAALASAISASVAADRPDVAEDARGIRSNVSRMMLSLKGCIARLRPPDLAEFGLVGGLSSLVTRWNSQNSGKTVYRLNLSEDFSKLDVTVAITIYRIAQECLTNASRHGDPTQVSLSLVRSSEAAAKRDSIDLVVEDDGGGSPDSVHSASGYGILGMRERLSTLGGELCIGSGAAGIRILARIPLERFPTKWAPVRRREARSIKSAGPASDPTGPGTVPGRTLAGQRA